MVKNTQTIIMCITGYSGPPVTVSHKHGFLLQAKHITLFDALLKCMDTVNCDLSSINVKT